VSITHQPKAGELLTGEEYESADHHLIALDATDIPTHSHAGEDINSGTVADARVAATLARDSEVTTAVSDHAGAADPHTGYRLESADHSHATTGLQGGTISYADLTSKPTIPSLGTSPSTQAFGDVAAGGSATDAAKTDHKHAMMANPVTAHEAAGDPHTGYVREADANWTDLTDGGATVLHTHAGGSGAPTDADYLVGTANGSLSNEIVVGTTPGGELGGTWASPTVDATHSGSTHAATQAAAEATAASALTTHAGAADPHTGYRLESADHTHASSGAQGGQIAYSALTGYPALTTASAYATATTAISAATYADITGCSVSLVAGTWLIYGNVVAFAANAIIQVFVAITHNDNTVISESAGSRPASGTASLNSPIGVALFAIVSPGSTTTYKLRGARGLTTHTGTWTAMDGNGVNTANHATNNSDKGTGIFAVRIA
jgi:hypothetical protein